MTDARPTGPIPTTGLTRDVGWELGVRRTAAVPTDVAWDHLAGAGAADWLGLDALPDRVGAEYRTADGTTGRIRSLTPGRRVRLTWRPQGRSTDSTVQLTVLPAVRGATIALHQEHLADAQERAELLRHWTAVLERLVVELEAR
jgi:uncharacterized protein YndB with AHSA1/START domain